MDNRLKRMLIIRADECNGGFFAGFDLCNEVIKGFDCHGLVLQIIIINVWEQPLPFLSSPPYCTIFSFALQEILHYIFLFSERNGIFDGQPLLIRKKPPRRWFFFRTKEVS